MSRTLSIPIRQTITLPDDWQACRTPQELSYWLISQFDEFEHEVETLAADIATLQGDLASLTTDVGNIDVRLVTIESQMSSVIASLGTINEQINDQTTGILARLTLLEQSYSGLSYDVASLDNTVNAPTTGLAARVAAIETDLTSIHDALITQGTDIAALKPDVAALKTTVGDSTSGLVKKTNDLDTEINGANGLDDRVTALENAGGGGKYLHRAHLHLKFQTIGDLAENIPLEFINENSGTYGTPNQFIEAWRASFGLNTTNTTKSFIGTYVIANGSQNIWLRIYTSNSPLIKALSFAVNTSTNAWSSSDMAVADWSLISQSVIAL